MKKFLALIFASTLILGACGTKDVEESAKKRKDPKTEVDDKGRVKGEKDWKRAKITFTQINYFTIPMVG